MHDVIISGAGPSGSRCAEVLAGKGYKVALLEKDSNWRKPCGGGVGHLIFKFYPQLKKLNMPQIRSISMFSAKYYKLEHSFTGHENYSTVTDRLEFDNLLRNYAVDAGAELHDKHLTQDFIYKDGKPIGVKVKSPAGTKEFKGKIIVIAEGMSSKLVIKSGLRERYKSEELGIAKAALIEGKHNLDPDRIYVYFRPYKGYGWIFPIGENKFNIGCGTFGEDNKNYNLNEIYEEFLKEPDVKGYWKGDHYDKIWEASFPVPTTGVLEKSLYKDNMMIIGDAAGFVSPISAEGIHTCVMSGQAAADTAIEALEKEDFSSKTLRKYKTHRYVKKSARNFKLKKALVGFFYENRGENLNKMFHVAENDDKFREEVVNTFLFNMAPSKDFFSRIQSVSM